MHITSFVVGLNRRAMELVGRPQNDGSEVRSDGRGEWSGIPGFGHEFRRFIVRGGQVLNERVQAVRRCMGVPAAFLCLANSEWQDIPESCWTEQEMEEALRREAVS